MNRRTIRAMLGGGLFIAGFLGLCTSGGLAESPPENQSWEKRSDQRFETVEPGGTVRVVNPYGNIYARFGGYENQVEVLSTIQRIEKDRPELEVRLERVEGGLDVTVVPRDAEGTPPPAEEWKDRADLVIFVPKESTLLASTEGGRIEVKGIKGDLVADSVKGDLWIRGVEGSVQAKTDRGQITATLETGVTPAAQELSTVTGEIELHLWEDADMSVNVATSGLISTDFSMTIEHRRFEEPGKRAQAKVGQGGPQLNLYSKRGPIRLLRLPRHFKTDEKKP